MNLSREKGQIGLKYQLVKIFKVTYDSDWFTNFKTKVVGKICNFFFYLYFRSFSSSLTFITLRILILNSHFINDGTDIFQSRCCLTVNLKLNLSAAEDHKRDSIVLGSQKWFHR